jgi:hypothetical protein
MSVMVCLCLNGYKFFVLIFICQIISFSSNVDHRIMTIVKSMNDYFCQNYVFTCFFRQHYHQEQADDCKSFFILHSCLYYDTDSIHMCHRSILTDAKKKLFDKTPEYCFTSSTYRMFSAQHIRSIAIPRITLDYHIFVFILLIISL